MEETFFASVDSDGRKVNLEISDFEVRFYITDQLELATKLAEKSGITRAIDIDSTWTPIFEILTKTELTQEQLSILTNEEKISNCYKENPANKYKISNVYVPGYLSVGEDLYLEEDLSRKNVRFFDYPWKEPGYIGFLIFSIFLVGIPLGIFAMFVWCEQRSVTKLLEQPDAVYLNPQGKFMHYSNGEFVAISSNTSPVVLNQDRDQEKSFPSPLADKNKDSSSSSFKPQEESEKTKLQIN